MANSGLGGHQLSGHSHSRSPEGSVCVGGGQCGIKHQGVGAFQGRRAGGPEPEGPRSQEAPGNHTRCGPWGLEVAQGISREAWGPTAPFSCCSSWTWPRPTWKLLPRLRVLRGANLWGSQDCWRPGRFCSLQRTVTLGPSLGHHLNPALERKDSFWLPVSKVSCFHRSGGQRRPQEAREKGGAGHQNPLFRAAGPSLHTQGTCQGAQCPGILSPPTRRQDTQLDTAADRQPQESPAPVGVWRPNLGCWIPLPCCGRAKEDGSFPASERQCPVQVDWGVGSAGRDAG